MKYDPNVDYGALLKAELGDDFTITPTGFTLGRPVNSPRLETDAMTVEAARDEHIHFAPCERLPLVDPESPATTGLKQRVLVMHERFPAWTATLIAREAGCTVGYAARLIRAQKVEVASGG